MDGGIIDLTTSSGSDDDGGKTSKVPSAMSVPFKKRKCEETTTSVPPPKASPVAPTLEPIQPQLVVPDFALSDYLENVGIPVLHPQVALPIPCPSVATTSTSAAADPRSAPNHDDSFHGKRVRFSAVEKAPTEKLDQLARQVCNLTKTRDRVVARLKERSLHPVQKPGTKLINDLRTSQGKITRRRRSSGVEHSRILEQMYAKNPFPSPSDFLLIREESKIPLPKIKQWFAQRNRNAARPDRPHPLVNSGGTSPLARQNCGTPERCITESGSEEDMEATGIIIHPTIEGRSRQTLKFLKDPVARKSDAILTDIGRVKNYDIQIFRDILETSWEKKADRLYKLARTENASYSQIKVTLHKEARRLKEINADVDLLSEEQIKEASEWETRFKLKYQCQGDTDEIMMEHILKEYVRPWLEPFMYGRVTSQDDRLLTLVVALHDFSKATHRSSKLKWETPEHLQVDLPDI